jgi:hypothetical protein
MCPVAADLNRRSFVCVIATVLLAGYAGSRSIAADEAALSSTTAAMLRQYCADCHGYDSAEAGINLEQMAAADLGHRFRDWEKVIRMLRLGKMPPAEAPQPEPSDRQGAITALEEAFNTLIKRGAGDPGPVVMRRLTSAEYAYSIRDLTGLDLNLEQGFVSDAVGGEGFTNVGGAQFMQDSTLERYLEAARTVAEHAVIGGGPLSFYERPGETGRELSAITRIREFYRRHGFRTGAGEGAEPFGLDLYPRAFFVAWRHKHRTELGLGDVTLGALAEREGLSVRFCEHVWNVVHRPASSFPLSVVVARWESLPEPGDDRLDEAAVRAACDDLCSVLRDWQRTLAASAGDEEEASVLTAGDVHIRRAHSFTAEIDWADGADAAEFEVSVATASQRNAAGALVIWRNPRLRLQHEDGRRKDNVPLTSCISPESVRRLACGMHPAGAAIGEHDFVLAGEAAVPVTLLIPEGMIGARLAVDVELDVEHGADRIVRCSISDGAVAGETAAEVGATSTLLGDPDSPAIAEWRTGVAEFARVLPEVSHREPAPSDRDPIPPPFDNTYNMPERNHFHTAIKYHRDDRFLVEHVLDDAGRAQLDQAWTDLLTSFEYHDANLRFIAQKFAIALGDSPVADLDGDTVDRLPPEPRAFVRRLLDEHAAMQQALRAAEPGHVEDALLLAERAWRRPLTTAEQQRLRSFYTSLREEARLEHTPAMRALLARILVAPAFLYRSESGEGDSGVVPLSDWELAGRLSYFLWSSLPDDELRRAAAAGELRDTGQLAIQARRMLRDPKARRLAAEFFGQWFGFYRFDGYRGIDAGRFPEFDESLKAAMHEEAVSFFEYIVHEDRPVSEILFADYAFVNATLARHYGMDAAELPADRHIRVGDVAAHHRGGLLGLGAVLTATSAPLRTSAVKRGDWVLRRVIGTPVPPPPADAGSIPADDALPDGLTVRQRLEAHRTGAACVNCHSRIDPLGFALEHYDPIGRWREEYRDGQPIDSSGVLNDGTQITGLDGLREYLRREEPQFHRNLAVKLLGYALGRAEIVTDRPLIHQITDDLEHDGRFSDVVVRIAASRQFGYRRE